MVPSHTGGAQDHPLLNRIKDFGGLDSETCSSPRAYAYVEKRGGTARACVCVRARRTRKGDGGRDAYRDEISKRNRGKEEARSRAHVSFLSFSFPPFPFFTRRSEHGGSAFREEEGACEGDWKHGGEGVVAGGSYRVGHARSLPSLGHLAIRRRPIRRRSHNRFFALSAARLPHWTGRLSPSYQPPSVT